MEKLVIVGSGGSIGTTALDIVKEKGIDAEIISLEEAKERGITIISNEPEPIPFLLNEKYDVENYTPPPTRAERRKAKREEKKRKFK